MKTINQLEKYRLFLVFLWLFIYISQKVLGLAESSLQHTTSINPISTWSIEKASYQPIITNVEPSPDGKYALIARKFPAKSEELQPRVKITLIENRVKSHKGM